MKRRRFFTSLTWLSAAISNRPDAGAATMTTSMAAIDDNPQSAVDAIAALEHYLRRIEAIDRQGPQLRSIIEVNPDAHRIAASLDAKRRAGHAPGTLHGAVLVVKDNIATGDRMFTTAGSLALDGVRATRDAFLIARLRDAGAIIAGKANLSEWANIRSTRATSGWSARGGLTRNPHALDRNPSGSSAGSAVAVAAGLAAMAIGTETDGSITSPAAINGVIGLKPTVGRVSRDGIVPISSTQDTAGPIARTVSDAARLLTAIAGRDSNDPATLDAPAPEDYAAGLDRAALRGARIGVAREYFTGHDEVDGEIERALAQLIALGATIIDPIELPKVDYASDELSVLLHEFKHELPRWLAHFAPDAPVKNLADVIAFNEAHREHEMPFFGQELFAQAQALGDLNSDEYSKARATCVKRAREEGLDHAFRQHRLDAIVAPTGGTAWLTDLINGDSAADGFSTPAAVAGYPHLTVPAGLVRGLPVGLSFVGPAWSEARLLGYGYAFEQATHWGREPRFVVRSGTPPLAKSV